MNRAQLLIRWADELGLKGDDQMPLFCMLRTLTDEELSRYFIAKDKEHGLSNEKISRKYRTTVGVVKGQIRIVKKLAPMEPK
jgi:ABC-type phosphate/phosphonate transport system ATPase subunit